MAAAVAAPTARRAVGQQRTRVRIPEATPGGNRDGVGETADGDGRRAARGRAGAELTRRIQAPALRRAIAEQGAGVRVATGDGDDIRQAAHRDGDEAQTAAHAAVAELTGGVAAPTRDGAVSTHRAGVVAPGGNVSRGDGAAPAGRGHGCQAARPSAVTELTGGVATPAARRAVGEDRAGVKGSGVDDDGVGETKD